MVLSCWASLSGEFFTLKKHSRVEGLHDNYSYTYIYIYERMYLCNINILTTRTKKFTFQVHQRDTEKGREKEYESDNRGGYL